MRVEVRFYVFKDSDGYDIEHRVERPCTREVCREMNISWTPDREGTHLPGGTYLVARGGPVEHFLIRENGFATFERVVNTSCTAEAALALVNELGPLLEPDLLLKNAKGGTTRWRKRFGPARGRSGHGYELEQDIFLPLRELRSGAEAASKRDIRRLADLANQAGRTRHLEMEYSRRGNALPSFFVEPLNLLQYAWLGLLQAVSIGAALRNCSRCENFFVVSTEKGARTSRKFCSDRCRVAAHRGSKR